MTAAYDILASYYEKHQKIVMAAGYEKDLAFDRRADFSLAFLEKYLGKTLRDKLIFLDLGCGTAEFIIELAKKGFKSYGIDISAGMLSQAWANIYEENSLDEKLLPQVFCMDICNYDLDIEVDFVSCHMDAINHIIRKKDLNSFFFLASKHIKKGGVLNFDCLMEEHFLQLASSAIYREDSSILLWENEYDKIHNLNTAQLQLFELVNDNKDIYQASKTVIQERFWPEDMLRETAKHNGFELKLARDFINRKDMFFVKSI